MNGYEQVIKRQLTYVIEQDDKDYPLVKITNYDNKFAVYNKENNELVTDLFDKYEVLINKKYSGYFNNIYYKLTNVVNGKEIVSIFDCYQGKIIIENCTLEKSTNGLNQLLILKSCASKKYHFLDLKIHSLDKQLLYNEYDSYKTIDDLNYVVKVNDWFGMYELGNGLIVEPKYLQLEIFENGFNLRTKRVGYQQFALEYAHEDALKNEFVIDCEGIKILNQSILAIKKNNKYAIYAFINNELKALSDYLYDDVDSYLDNYFIVKVNDLYTVLHIYKNYLKCQCDEFNNCLNDELFKGEVIKENININYIGNRYIVYDNNKIMIINKVNDRYVIEEDSDDLTIEFVKNLLVMKNIKSKRTEIYDQDLYILKRINDLVEVTYNKTDGLYNILDAVYLYMDHSLNEQASVIVNEYEHIYPNYYQTKTFSEEKYLAVQELIKEDNKMADIVENYPVLVRKML